MTARLWWVFACVLLVIGGRPRGAQAGVDAPVRTVVWLQDNPELLERVRGQLSDLDATIVPVPEALPAQPDEQEKTAYALAETHNADLVTWVAADTRAPASWQPDNGSGTFIAILFSSDRHVFAGRLSAIAPRAASAERRSAEYELAAVSVRSAVRALLQVRRETPHDKSNQEAEPPSPTPSQRFNVSVGGSWTHDGQTESGTLSAEVAGGIAWADWEVWLGAAVSNQATIEMISNRITFRRVDISLEGRYALRLSERLSVGPLLGLGHWWFLSESDQQSSNVVDADSGADSTFIMSPGVFAEWWLTDAHSLQGKFSAAWLIDVPTYRLGIGASPLSVEYRFNALHPRVGASWRMSF